MSTNPAVYTDEPSSRLSTRLSPSPDEDPGTARQAQNGSRGLAATAPRSLSSLPTEILQNIFAQLHSLLAIKDEEKIRGRPVALEHIVLSKRIFGIAYPLWTRQLFIPEERDSQDRLLTGLLEHSEAAQAVCKLDIALLQDMPNIACYTIGKLKRLSRLTLVCTISRHAYIPMEYPTLPARLLDPLKGLQSLTYLRLEPFDFDAEWTSIRLDQAIPSLRELHLFSTTLLEALAHGLARIEALTVQHSAFGRRAIPWDTILRVKLTFSHKGTLDAAAVLETLRLRVFDPVKPPIPLQHLEISLQPARTILREFERGSFKQEDLHSLFETLQESSLLSLSFDELSDLGWINSPVQLTSVQLLSLHGSFALTAPSASQDLMAIVRIFPNLRTLRMRGNRLFDPDPSETQHDGVSLDFVATMLQVWCTFRAAGITEWIFEPAGCRRSRLIGARDFGRVDILEQ